MPDLIIKPENTSGNKLILKDQAGGAVLTTSDSGATLGNSTQDNITRLGTVTTGTLQSGVTFPAGHVVQVIKGEFDVQNSSATTNWDYKTSIEVAITPKLNNSKMYITSAFVCYNATTSATFYFDLYRNSSSLTETYNLTGDDRGMILMVADGAWTPVTLSWLDDSSAMTSRGDKNAITYAVTMKVSAGTGTFNNNNRTQIIITEIAV
jgi:hypothetical protein